jgi:hypothetical protein
LQTIQRVWETGREPDKIELRLLLLRNIHAIMTHILTPIADILVQQPLTNPSDGRVAAPCFNYAPRGGSASKPESLYYMLKFLANKAAQASPDKDMKALFDQMKDYMEQKLAPN